jgi:hypothetical protein
VRASAYLPFVDFMEEIGTPVERELEKALVPALVRARPPLFSFHGGSTAKEQFSLNTRGTTMRNFMILIAATSVALSSAMAAWADDNPLPKANDVLERYGKDIEGWTVYSNKTRGDCLIVHDYGPNAQGAVQMGVTQNDKEVGYLGVFTKADIGIQSGNQSPIFVSIGGKLYGGVVTSTKAESGYSGGYILTDDPDFKRAVAKQYEMIVFPETVGAFVVDLKGTFRAMAAGRKCLEEQ